MGIRSDPQPPNPALIYDIVLGLFSEHQAALLTFPSWFRGLLTSGNSKKTENGEKRGLPLFHVFIQPYSHCILTMASREAAALPQVITQLQQQ